MQGDAVAIDPMDMGTPRVPRTKQPESDIRCQDKEAQRHHECCARGHILGYQREVPFALLCPWVALIHPRRFLTVSLGGSAYIFFPFVKCLQSLPNLHTLEVGRADDFPGAPLKSALKGVELPQIKTLIISPPAYPLLQRCREVEDVVCMVVFPSMSPERVLRSLASNRDSKVKRLAIPLTICAHPSRKRFRAAGW